MRGQHFGARWPDPARTNLKTRPRLSGMQRLVKTPPFWIPPQGSSTTQTTTTRRAAAAQTQTVIGPELAAPPLMDTAH